MELSAASALSWTDEEGSRCSRRPQAATLTCAKATATQGATLGQRAQPLFPSPGCTWGPWGRSCLTLVVGADLGLGRDLQRPSLEGACSRLGDVERANDGAGCEAELQGQRGTRCRVRRWRLALSVLVARSSGCCGTACRARSLVCPTRECSSGRGERQVEPAAGAPLLNSRQTAVTAKDARRCRQRRSRSGRR